MESSYYMDLVDKEEEVASKMRQPAKNNQIEEGSDAQDVVVALKLIKKFKNLAN